MSELEVERQSMIEHLALINTLKMCVRRGYTNVYPTITLEQYQVLARQSSTNVIIFDLSKPMKTQDNRPVLIVIHRPFPSLTKIDNLAITRTTKDKSTIIDPSGLGIFNQIMNKLGMSRQVIPKHEDRLLKIILEMLAICHPIILYHQEGIKLSDFPKIAKDYTFHPDSLAPLLDFFPVKYMTFDIIEHVGQPTIRYLPKESTESQRLIELFGTSHPYILATDPVARHFRAKAGDFFEFIRDEGSIHYRQVRPIDLSAIKEVAPEATAIDTSSADVIDDE